MPGRDTAIHMLLCSVVVASLLDYRWLSAVPIHSSGYNWGNKLLLCSVLVVFNGEIIDVVIISSSAPAHY